MGRARTGPIAGGTKRDASLDTESVLNALTLAANETPGKGPSSDATGRALDIMWSRQQGDGGEETKVRGHRCGSNVGYSATDLSAVAGATATEGTTSAAERVPISLAIYLSALIFKLTIPTWPTEGQWFFNPLCWQLVFVLGFAFSRERGPGGWVRANISWLRPAAASILIDASLPKPVLTP